MMIKEYSNLIGREQVLVDYLKVDDIHEEKKLISLKLKYPFILSNFYHGYITPRPTKFTLGSTDHIKPIVGVYRSYFSW